MYIDVQMTHQRLSEFIRLIIADKFPYCFYTDFLKFNKDTSKYLPDHIEFPNLPEYEINVPRRNTIKVSIDMYYYVVEIVRDNMRGIQSLKLVDRPIIVPLNFDIELKLRSVNSLIYSFRFTGISGDPKTINAQFKEYELPLFSQGIFFCMKDINASEQCQAAFASQETSLDISSISSLNFSTTTVGICEHVQQDSVCLRLSDVVINETFYMGNFEHRIAEDNDWVLFVDKNIIIPVLLNEMREQIRKASQSENFSIKNDVTISWVYYTWDLHDLKPIESTDTIAASFKGSAKGRCPDGHTAVDFTSDTTIQFLVESENNLSLIITTEIDPSDWDTFKCAVKSFAKFLTTLVFNVLSVVTFNQLFKFEGGGIFTFLEDLFNSMSSSSGTIGSKVSTNESDCDAGFIEEIIKNEDKLKITKLRKKICLNIEKFGKFSLLSVFKHRDGLSASGKLHLSKYLANKTSLDVADHSNVFHIKDCFGAIERQGISIQLNGNVWPVVCYYNELSYRPRIPDPEYNYFFRMTLRDAKFFVTMPVEIPKGYRSNPYPFELLILSNGGAHFIKIPPVTKQLTKTDAEKLYRENETTCLALILNLYRNYGYRVPIPKDPVYINKWLISLIVSNARIRSRFSMCIGDNCFASSRFFDGRTAIAQAIIPNEECENGIFIRNELPMSCKIFDKIFDIRKRSGSFRVTITGLQRIGSSNKHYNGIITQWLDSTNLLLGVSKHSVDFIKLENSKLRLTEQLLLTDVNQIVKMSDEEVLLTDRCGLLHINRNKSEINRVLELAPNMPMQMLHNYIYTVIDDRLAVVKLFGEANKACVDNVGATSKKIKIIQSIKLGEITDLLVHKNVLYVANTWRIYAFGLLKNGSLYRLFSRNVQDVTKLRSLNNSFLSDAIMAETTSKTHLYKISQYGLQPVVSYSQLPWEQHIVSFNNLIIQFENSHLSVYAKVMRQEYSGSDEDSRLASTVNIGKY